MVPLSMGKNKMLPKRKRGQRIRKIRHKVSKKCNLLKNSYSLTQSGCAITDHTYSIQSGYIVPNEPSPDYLWKFDAVICDFLHEQAVPGAALYMTYKGKPVYQQGYGINESGVPMLSSAHLRIASISKLFTAITVLRLCDEGKLKLKQHVFGRKGILVRFTLPPHSKLQGITVQHLLEHSAGWDRDIAGDPVFWYADSKHAHFIDTADPDSLIKYVITKKLEFTPGTRHAYSNLGYLILGMIIEQVTSMKYEHYVKSILREIDIEDISSGNDNQKKVHHIETKYYNNSDPVVKKSVYDSDQYVATQYGSFPVKETSSYSGWVTCAKNLVTILDHLCYEDADRCIFSKHSLQQMFKAPKFAEGEAWYGLGIDVEDNGLGFGHTGAMEGTTTTVHHTANGYSWALLLNAWANDTDLNGMIKYALTAVQSVSCLKLDTVTKDLNKNDITSSDPNSQSVVSSDICMDTEPLLDCESSQYANQIPHTGCNEYFLCSKDGHECVQILLPHNEFLSHAGSMKHGGYKIHHMDVVTVCDDVLFNVIWSKHREQSTDWKVLIDVTTSQLTNIETYKKTWKVTHIQSYIKDDELMHLFVFESSTVHEQIISYMIKDIDYMKHVSEVEGPGFQLTRQCVVNYRDSIYITAVFEKFSSDDVDYAEETCVWYDLSIEKYPVELGVMVRQGLYMKDFSVYTARGDTLVSAIWHKHPSLTCDNLENNVFQRHDVSKYGFLYEMKETMDDNLPVKFISAYVNNDVIYFASVWDIKHRKLNRAASVETVIQYENPDISEFHQSLIDL